MFTNSAAPQRSQRNVANPQNVVADAFVRMEFDQADVFVRCRMKHELRFFFVHKLVHEITASEIDQERTQQQVRITFTQSTVDVKKTVLRLVQQQQLGGRAGCNLPRELGADTSPCAGNQDRFPADDLGDLLGVVVDFLAIEQVADVGRAQFILRDAPIDQFRKCRQGPYRQVGLPARRQDPAHFRSRRARNANQDFVRLAVAGHGG